MTKERKLNCLSLPNKLYKKNHCIVTKLRKSFQKNNDNINILSRKNDNIKNKNNSINVLALFPNLEYSILFISLFLYFFGSFFLIL